MTGRDEVAGKALENVSKICDVDKIQLLMSLIGEFVDVLSKLGAGEQEIYAALRWMTAMERMLLEKKLDVAKLDVELDKVIQRFAMSEEAKKIVYEDDR
jgi:hypothetical protein